MNRISRQTRLGLSVMALGLCLGSPILAQTPTTPPEPKPVIVGGFSPINIHAPKVRQAARFAIKAHSKDTHKAHSLRKILKAESQVVAGINYRLCLKVAEAKDSKTHLIQAVVYQDLEQTLSLSQWTHVTTCD